MKKFIILLPFVLLIFSIFFNLYFLFPETKIKSEVNDNVFAYGLILRMDKAWSEGNCPLSLNCMPKLFDHWNSQWAMGFPLPNFYQHIPDLGVVLTYKIFQQKIPLWDVFEWFKYLMLSFIPLSYFISAKKFGFNNLSAGFTALVSTQISTQYLYGTDLNALIWRGSGMFTQLWGIFFLPLAVSSVYEYLTKEKKTLLQPVIFLSLAISSHVVFGFIALGSSFFIPFILASKGVPLRSYFKKLLLIFISSFLILSYWLIPLLQNSVFRNKSIWDDINKFDSYGFKQIIEWFLNGQIFDANRPPVLTIIVIIGIFLTLYLSSLRNLRNLKPHLLLFPVLFIFWFLLYFGRKTWGPLIDIIPLMEDMHIHRFINGVHFAGIFLIGITLEYIIMSLREASATWQSRSTCLAARRGLLHFVRNDNLNRIIIIIFIIAILIPVFKERKEYMEYNSKLISDYNKFWDIDNKDFKKVLEFLGPAPIATRIYPGRPGNWGNDFYVGSTKVYLELSQRGYDVFEFLPETWSLNSDIEQYFDENNEDHFNTFNVGLYLAPRDRKVPPFAKKIFESGKYVLYKIESSKNFGIIESPIAISVEKNTFLNPQISWLKSDWPKNHLFPSILYSQKTKIMNENQKIISMLDNTTYKLDGDYFPLLSFSPFSSPKEKLLAPKRSEGKIKNEFVTASSYSATINTSENSNLLLKVTYHPSWKAKVDGRDTQIYMVSPSFMAIKVPPGNHQVEFTYQASALKTVLIYLSFTILIGVMLLSLINIIFKRRKNALQ